MRRRRFVTVEIDDLERASGGLQEDFGDGGVDLAPTAGLDDLGGGVDLAPTDLGDFGGGSDFGGSGLDAFASDGASAFGGESLDFGGSGLDAFAGNGASDFGAGSGFGDFGGTDFAAASDFASGSGLDAFAGNGASDFGAGSGFGDFGGTDFAAASDFGAGSGFGDFGGTDFAAASDFASGSGLDAFAGNGASDFGGDSGFGIFGGSGAAAAGAGLGQDAFAGSAGSDFGDDSGSGIFGGSGAAAAGAGLGQDAFGRSGASAFGAEPSQDAFAGSDASDLGAGTGLDAFAGNGASDFGGDSGFRIFAGSGAAAAGAGSSLDAFAGNGASDFGGDSGFGIFGGSGASAFGAGAGQDAFAGNGASEVGGAGLDIAPTGTDAGADPVAAAPFLDDADVVPADDHPSGVPNGVSNPAAAPDPFAGVMLGDVPLAGRLAGIGDDTGVITQQQTTTEKSFGLGVFERREGDFRMEVEGTGIAAGVESKEARIGAPDILGIGVESHTAYAEVDGVRTDISKEVRGRAGIIATAGLEGGTNRAGGSIGLLGNNFGGVVGIEDGALRELGIRGGVANYSWQSRDSISIDPITGTLRPATDFTEKIDAGISLGKILETGPSYTRTDRLVDDRITNQRSELEAPIRINKGGVFDRIFKR